jgi:hypothetical protein
MTTPAAPDTKWVVRIIGLVDGRRNEHSGTWLESFDPERGRDPYRGQLRSTGQLARARHFDSQPDAHAYWTQRSKRQPARPWDGQPNRPMTAYTIMVLRADLAASDYEAAVRESYFDSMVREPPEPSS